MGLRQKCQGHCQVGWEAVRGFFGAHNSTQQKETPNQTIAISTLVHPFLRYFLEPQFTRHSNQLERCRQHQENDARAPRVRGALQSQFDVCKKKLSFHLGS